MRDNLGHGKNKSENNYLKKESSCRSIKIVYYLKCNMCSKTEMYIGKTVDDNIIGFNLE